MLHSLHVKNLALIEETEISFGEGLNILTGETGAGKSILLGSMNFALGAKIDKDMIREGADTALVELVFDGSDPLVTELLEEFDIPVEDMVTISRKMTAGKSTGKINGETVNAKQLKAVAELLVDIHGQHEHQSLLQKKKQREILDSFAGAEQALEQVASLYGEWRNIQKTLSEEEMDEVSKEKEASLLSFEVEEIENARLEVGEDEELESSYRKMVNYKKIAESLQESYACTGSDDGAAAFLGRAIRAMRNASQFDEGVADMEMQLSEIENLLSDFNREISSYLSDMEFDEADFARVEERLNLINRMKDKYGMTIELVLESLSKKQERLAALADYDAYIAQLKAKEEQAKKSLIAACEKLTQIRMKAAECFTKQLTEALVNLNFLSVDFEVAITPSEELSANGADEIAFLISTNPGERPKALSMVASGGELSRIMLAIKTLLASKDEIDTLIFVVIDAGISGATAWKVSEELSKVSRAHQVICITHLPQIAAMADYHFMIEKQIKDGSTVTEISPLLADGSLGELARLLGSGEQSEAALSNAKDMLEKAILYKNSL